MKLVNGSHIKFLEDTLYCGTNEAFNVKSRVRVGGIEVNGEMIDGDAFNNPDMLEEMRDTMSKNGFIKDDEIVVPAGEIAKVIDYAPNTTFLSFVNGLIKLDFVSNFVSKKTDDEEEIWVEVI